MSSYSMIFWCLFYSFPLKLFVQHMNTHEYKIPIWDHYSDGAQFESVLGQKDRLVHAWCESQACNEIGPLRSDPHHPLLGPWLIHVMSGTAKKIYQATFRVGLSMVSLGLQLEYQINELYQIMASLSKIGHTLRGIHRRVKESGLWPSPLSYTHTAFVARLPYFAGYSMVTSSI